jgi:hypothetical protein
LLFLREQRHSEAELWREFELARPGILGALLDALALGLRGLPRLRLARLPRMADFALWATACETALWPAGTFVCAYEANRNVAIDGAIDADLASGRLRARDHGQPQHLDRERRRAVAGRDRSCR